METLQLTNQNPDRLDKIIPTLLPISRSQGQKYIESGKILVDGLVVPAKTLVNQESVITYDPDILTPEEKTGELPTFKILAETDAYLVIDKPAGVLVHEAESSNEYTLVDALIKRYPDIESVGDHPKRAGLVHRLDKSASGVMIIAKTQSAFEHLKTQFKERLVKKHYTVLIRGNLPRKVGTIDFPISRSKNTGRMAAKPESQGGKRAITHYKTIKAYPHHTLLDVEIETGRTHQIRVHFFALGNPVVGDTLYCQSDMKTRDIGRLFLHARTLTITVPNGETITFEAELPTELQSVLETIPTL